MREVTEKEFEIFRKEAKWWIEFFGLSDWRVFFDFYKLDNDVFAECHTGMEDKTATLVLNKWNDIKEEHMDIERTAFHEVCELLLNDMEMIALDDEIPFEKRRELAAGARHGVIRRLENSIFPKTEQLRQSF